MPEKPEGLHVDFRVATIRMEELVAVAEIAAPCISRAVDVSKVAFVRLGKDCLCVSTHKQEVVLGRPKWKNQGNTTSEEGSALQSLRRRKLFDCRGYVRKAHLSTAFTRGNPRCAMTSRGKIILEGETKTSVRLS